MTDKQRIFELEKALEDEKWARSSLETTNASLQRENEFLRQHFNTAIENERNTLKMLANVSMQGRYGMTPFPEAKGLPEDGKVEAVQQPAHTSQGIDIVRERSAHFMNDYKQRFSKGEVGIEPSVIEQFIRTI